MSAPRRRSLAVLLGAALLSAAACSDSTAPDDHLTADEANELAARIGLQLFGESGGFLSFVRRSNSLGGEGSAAVPQPFNVSVETDVPCIRSGRAHLVVTLKGVLDEVAESMTADVDGTYVPNNCGILVHRKLFRISGSLSLGAHFEVAHGLPVGTHTATMKGNFTWRATDGRMGTCAIDFASSANYTTRVATVNGSFCGSTIQFTGPLTTD
jgi:hypothetical protein